MEEGDRKNYLDEDILKALTHISYTKEKFSLVKNEKLRLVKLLKEKNDEIKKLLVKEQAQLNCFEENKKLISEQQITISKLLYVKDDIKKYKEVINEREQRILDIEQEKFDLAKEFEKNVEKVQSEHNKEIENLKDEIKNVKNELSIVKSEAVCKSMKADDDIIQAKAKKDEQINKLVLDYEEKLQRAHAQFVRMKDELNNLAQKSNSTIATLKEKIFNLEHRQNQRTNIVKPNVNRNMDLSKTNQNRPQFQSNLNTQNYISANQNKDYNFERPLSRASNILTTSYLKNQDCLDSSSSFVPFHLASKQQNKNPETKYNKGSTTDESIDANLEHTSVTEDEGGKKKPLKRKLFSKYSEDFEEMD